MTHPTTNGGPPVIAPGAGLTATVQPPARLSMTFIRESQKCLRLAHLEREAGVSGAPARIGRAFHAIAAAVGWATVLAGHRQPSPRAAEVVMERFLGTHAEGWGFTREDYDDVRSLVRRWAPDAEFEPDEQFERLYRTPLDGRILSAKIDRLRVDGDTAYVGDYKTGRGNPPEGPTVQGDHYAWHVLTADPLIEYVEYEEHWVRWGLTRPDPPVVYDRLNIGKVEDWLRSRIRVIDDAYRSPRLPVQPGGWCFHCPAPTTCPHPEWVRAESAVRTVEDATGHLEAIIVEEARIKHRKRLIRPVVEGSGVRAITAGGEELGFAEKPGSSLDTKAVEADGIDLEPYRKATPPSFGRRKAR